jgi:disulfide bond formation protein DsbB
MAFEFVKSLSDRVIIGITAAVSAATLAGAHGFENFANLPPCPLCLDQREPYWAAIALALLALGALKWDKLKDTRLPIFLMGAIVLALGYGAYLAGYHTGIEQKWWPGPATCTGAGAALTIEQMLGQTDAKIVMCDEIPWSLFGISLAGYNLLIALGLTAFASIPILRRTRIASASQEDQT